MSIILRSIQVAHIMGVFIIASVFLYNLNVRSESPPADTQNADSKPGSSGALSVVAYSEEDGDEEDGIITIEGNGSDDDEIDETLELFEPTDEWKAVKKGQKIPPGLHVRMNLQTGDKEAKLMKQTEGKNMERWDAGEKIGIINTEKKRYTRDELKRALKDFKYKADIELPDKEHEEEVKQKFRSMEELKKIMEELNLNMKTEGQIVTELESELKQKDIAHDRLKLVLVDLEYYLHQIDNAKIFCDLGGMKTLIRLMNSTEEDIREAATHTVGAALQSNPKVQVAAVDTGVLQQLLKMVSVDSSALVRKRALFALSTLLRQFPYAQKKFLQLGGLSALNQLFVESKDENLKIRIVTLLTDMLHEYDHNVNQATLEDNVQAQRTLQYKEVPLRENLHKNGWCGLTASLLHSASGHDSVEKIVSAMLALASTCKEEFSLTRPKLQALLADYQKLAQEEHQEGSGDVFSAIYSAIQKLIAEVLRDDL
ncbi:unnamed protein product [Candidula unifasciata]|uniref:Nucleotide exchange factor SIL1 n=1 Tax=Candidula unifasciata TaxID=100452 RepID=A0A8S3Z4J3_9EUPU|nr:unnamed protein product [Candidula unifasciata]